MSFPTKYTVPEETDTLTDARAAVAKLEAEHRDRGLHLSGRIIHVVHYLPIVTTLRTKADDPLISPPKTPEAVDIVTLETTRSSARKYFFDSLLHSRTRLKRELVYYSSFTIPRRMRSDDLPRGPLLV